MNILIVLKLVRQLLESKSKVRRSLENIYLILVDSRQLK